MAPASPLRQLLTLSILSAAMALLWATRPRFAADSTSSEAFGATCSGNLSQISRAYAQYARDFDGKIPLAIDPEDKFNPRIWSDTQGTLYGTYLQTAPFVHVILRPYVPSPQVFQCPADSGWSVSQLQTDPRTGENQGLRDVRPSSFAKYGTSYYSWTIYGFDLKVAADIPDPASRVLLFDGDLWHGSAGQGRAGALFIDGHAENVSQAQHHAFAPAREF